jgi:hypothetical protein
VKWPSIWFRELRKAGIWLLPNSSSFTLTAMGPIGHIGAAFVPLDLPISLAPIS